MLCWMLQWVGLLRGDVVGDCMRGPYRCPSCLRPGHWSATEERVSFRGCPVRRLTRSCRRRLTWPRGRRSLAHMGIIWAEIKEVHRHRVLKVRDRLKQFRCYSLALEAMRSPTMSPAVAGLTSRTAASSSKVLVLMGTLLVAMFINSADRQNTRYHTNLRLRAKVCFERARTK